MASTVTTNPLREQLRSMMHMDPVAAGENTFHGTLLVDPSFLVFPDHFPARPILPGMCMVQIILLAAATHQGVTDLALRSVKNAKMMYPIVPGDQIAIDGVVTPGEHGDLIIKSKLSSPVRILADISLVARLHPHDQAHP